MDDDDDAGNNTAAIERQGETFYITPQNIQNQILLLAARGHFRDAIGQLFRGRRTFLDDDDEDDDIGRPRRRARPTYFQPTEVVPNPKGQELMRSGDFGSVCDTSSQNSTAYSCRWTLSHCQETRTCG